MFGINVLIDHQTDAGHVTAWTDQTLTALETENVRFPGGQLHSLYGDGLLDNNDIPAALAAFLDDAKAQGLTVTLVVPVKPTDTSYDAWDA
ncbi:hypothetical protein, partial [Jannaschia marina]|uniref:hypothetical protein n=1 Tax=Jannaschia marina TaxID=2741674 RepID=UPI0015CC86C5